MKESKNELNEAYGWLLADAEIIQMRREHIKLVQNESASKKVSMSKPKGDIEMKNITYRANEKRYIGRKQIHGEILTVYAKTQKECMSKLNEKIKKVKSELKKKTQKSSQFTVLEYWEKWYKENKEPFIADSTKKDFGYVKNKLAPLFQIRLSQLTKEKILDFLSTLKDNRPKEKLIVQLKSMLATAVIERKMKYNPFDTIVTKLEKRKPKPPFNYEEQQKIIENLKGKDFQPIILLYLTTGLRKNELNFKEIENDIDEKNILTAINLKGRDRKIRYKKIKLSPAMVEMVIKNKEIFHKYTAGMIFEKFGKFLKNLHIKGSIVSCRHTFATNCFYLGKDSLIISREMGHTTSQITKDNYIDIDYNLSKEKILKLYNNLYNLT